MSFQQGLSGLAASAKNLDTIGNNVANANTVGFKGSTAQFADVFAASLNNAGTTQVGIGTKAANIAQQFTQGNITSTNNPLDLAINGSGFFRLSTNGAITYTRNGQFQLDKLGYMVNPAGSRLTGYSANQDGVLSTGAPAELQIDTRDLQPKESTKVRLQLNLDSNKVAYDLAAKPFQKDDPTTYHNASSVSVYDSLGNAHIFQTFYVKTHPLVDPTDPTAPDPAGIEDATWEVYGTVDGLNLPDTTSNTATKLGTITFAKDGSVLSVLDAADAPVLDALGNPLQQIPNIQIPVRTGALSPINVDAAAVPPTTGLAIDLSGTTQYGSVFGVNALSQDGFASGRLAGFSLNDSGTIVGRYTNGQVKTLGQVVLSNFSNPNGLSNLGGNQWIETASSGSPLTGAPGSSSLGVIQSSATEDSNVDLTAELVNMITAQRNYQANAQTIKAQDQVLQTLVNLR